MPVFEIVASAENNRYMEWQAMLFHFRCATVHGHAPIIAVHKGDEPLLKGFELIKAHGGIVQSVPNLRDFGGVHYPPRNTAVALKHVESSADYIVLCDADMVIVKPLPLQTLSIDKQTISFDYVGYLDPDRAVYQPHIDQVFRESGVDPIKLRKPVIDGGVPHVVPVELQRRLGDEWLECIDRFPIRFDGERPDCDDEKYADWPYRCYLASMWAIVMAKHRMGLKHIETRWCMSNSFDDYPMPVPSDSSACLLHYAYGSARFDKRVMGGDKSVSDSSFWQLPEDDGTIAGFLRGTIQEAGRFYALT